MNMRKCERILLVMLLVFFGGSLSLATAAEQDARYKRNGEAYLLIGKESELPAGNIDYRGIWRMSDPEGIFKLKEPQYLVGEVDILDMTVDLYRNIHTLSDPKKTAIGNNFKIKRQVIDDGVTIAEADKGCHSYIHYDHRNAYWGHNTPLYRTGPANRTVKGSVPIKSAGPGVETTAPDNPDAYLPKFSNAALQLGVHTGKKWYEIPNGAWYSSWNRKKGCQWFYQVFADKVTGTQYDWSLQQWKPNITAMSYSKQSGKPFATTYDMQIKRATLAGCLDGCGGASGDDAVKTDKMIFSSAFMPMLDKLGNATSRTYFYSRPEGKANYSITTTGEGSSNYVLKGDAVGYDKVPDTQWLGVSMKDENSDYLYCLGNSVIKKWIKDGGGNSTGINIAAVTVSNQWNQKGGIVFAFDEKEKMVYKFVRNEAGAHENSAFPISSILAQIGADNDAKIDDIKADGDGNLFVGLTFPGVDLTVKEVTSKWTLNNAYTYELQPPGSELQKGSLLFKQDFTKSIFRISAMGEPPKEVGKKVVATQVYKRDVAMDPKGWLELQTAGMGSVGTIVASWTTPPAKGTISDYSIYTKKSTDPDIGRARLAVINVPKPPDVLSLGGDKSYLDIIGAYKNSIPIFDPNKRSTQQNVNDRYSGTLDTRQLYFYMVENYPIPTGAQNPTVTPDYDGDGRYGGFVSTIINPNPSTDQTNPGTIRYHWRIWMVARQTGKDNTGKPIFEPLSPAEPMSESVAGSYFNWFYTPIGGKFIITCRVDYDWYDYTLVPFGTTITKFLSNPGNALKTGTKAVPSSGGSKLLHEPSTSQLDQIMNTTDFTFMKSSEASYKNTILGNDSNREYHAVVSTVVTDKEPPVPLDPTEIARVQRCDKAGNNPLTSTHWYPQTAGVMNPGDGFHGIRVGTEYHWRMDVASQAVFFQPLEKALNAANYNFIANKLTNPKETAYYVNSDPEFQFDKTGDDLRWVSGSTPTIEAYLKYPVPPMSGGKPTYVNHNLLSDSTMVPSQNFAYFTTKANLPPTDPFEAELVIEMSQMFQYDMRIYGTINGVKRLLGKVPNLPKKLTITAKTKVLIIDTVSPVVAFNKTTPTQLYGLTGRVLESGTNGNPSSIQFQVTDNDPWDGVSGITSHAKYSSSNILANKTTITNYYGKAGSAYYNLKPVFNTSNRGVQLYWNIASVNGSRQVSLSTNPYKPSYGSFSPGTGLGTPSVTSTKDPTTSTYYSALDFTVPLSGLNNGNPINLPKYYANNSPNYEPYKFWVSSRDCSGNESLDALLNLVIHMKDDIPPDPYAICQEFKNGTFARFPTNATLANDDQFENNFRAATSFNQTFVSRGNWMPESPGSNKTNEIWDGGNTGFQALWSVSDTISALPETMMNSTVTPATMQVEDNVEVLMRVGASDNSGAATAKLTFRYFDINKAEQAQSTGSSTFTLPGISATAMTSAQSSTRAVFREGTSVKFPMAIPISIRTVDDARNWDKYTACNISNGTWSWGPMIKGGNAPNRRLFRTTLPVYGSELTIRTIESGVRTPGK